MYCPTLNDLPSPPPDKIGWPWTEGTLQLPNNEPDSPPWPRISIVTPSYNQGQFIEETIRSVLLQGYPNLEYIIIDGDSADNSVDIIHRYAPWLTAWVSEPDRGQAHAINKGFARCTGDLLGWINSDDVLLGNALAHIAVAYSNNPQSGFFGGDCLIIDKQGLIVKVLKGTQYAAWFGEHGFRVRNPVWFYTRWAYDRVGGLNNEYDYVMDTELFFRMSLEGFKFFYIPEILSAFRMHPSSKTVFQIEAMQKELAMLLDKNKMEFTGILPVGSLKWIYLKTRLSSLISFCGRSGP